MKKKSLFFLIAIMAVAMMAFSQPPPDPAPLANCPVVHEGTFEVYCGVPVEIMGYNFEIDNLYGNLFPARVTATLVETYGVEMEYMPTSFTCPNSYGDYSIDGTPDLQAGYSEGYYKYQVCATAIPPLPGCSTSCAYVYFYCY